MIIVDNINLPARTAGASKFAAIQIGQTAIFPGVDTKQVKNLQGSLNNFKKAHEGVKFETRTIKEAIEGLPDGIVLPAFAVKRTA